MMFYTLLLVSLIATAYGQTGSCPSSAGITGCQDCHNPPLECVTCRDRYFFKDAATCLKCPTNCGTCKDSNADDKTECTDCDDYYFKTSDDQCKACNGHCKDCTEDWKCDKCGESYRKEAVKPISCEECSTGCAHCLDKSSSSCLDCHRGYYFSQTKPDSGTCTKCGTGCLDCTSGTTCDLCTSGSTWTGSSCTPCITNCDIKSCDTNGGCQKCISGWFLTNAKNQCRSCANCKTCQEIGGCTECNPGYILNSDATCQVCPNVDKDATTCMACSSSNRGRIFEQEQCKYCPLNCKSCSTSTACSTCFDKFFVDNGQCTACDATCETCNGAAADKCTKCAVGFGLVSNECKACPEATGTPDCTECSGTTCTKCNSNTFITPTTTTDAAKRCRSCAASEITQSSNVCTQCAPSNRGRFMSTSKCAGCDGYSDCAVCDSSKCLECNDGYFLSGTTCTQCTITGCAKCKTSTICDTCSATYYKTAAGTCSACVADCDSCKDSYTCEQCSSNNYIQHKTLCVACTVTNCKTCTPDLATCSKCEPGYYKDGNTCKQCGTGCDECTSSTMCTKCLPGYTKIGTECKKCGVSECQVCDANNNDDVDATTKGYEIYCETCKDNYIKNDLPKKCFSITTTDNCLRYLSDGTTCAYCKSTHFKMTSGGGAVTCVSCDSTCLTCSGSANTACTSCVSGQILTSGGSCVAPGSCAVGSTNCATCYTDSTEMCATCDSGYTLTLTKTCVETVCGTTLSGLTTSAMVECVSCVGSSATDCLACKITDASVKAYFFPGSGDKKCGACSGNCLKCSDGSTCTACEVGFKVSGAACVACTLSQCDDCFDMGGTEKCKKCATGYTLNDDATSCTQCSSSSLDSNCGSCSVTTTCDYCKDGYKAHLPQSCPACTAQNCKKCMASSTTACASTMGCKDGFYYASSSKCETCGISNCKACSKSGSTITCSECMPGYSFHMNECHKCASNCDACDTATGVAVNTCKTCADKYKVEKICNVCKDSNCEVCTDDQDSCTKCKDNFFVDNKKCTSCPSNCKTCTSATSCQICKDSFEKSSGSCISITSSLPNCVDDTNNVCVKCNTGYFLDPSTSLCVSCSSAGKDSAKYVCEQCKSQNGNDGVQNWIATCEDCPDNCISCSSASVCSKCVDGMYTDGKQCLALSCSLPSITHENACIACSTTNFNSDDEHRALFWDKATSSCKECPRNCKSCLSETTCATCDGSFVFSSSELACVACNFEDSATCTGCIYINRGRYLDNLKQCFLCDTYCTKCEGSPSFCTECYGTHYLENNKCKACTSTDITNEGCTSCQSTNAAWKTDVHAWLLHPSTGGADPVSKCTSCPSFCAQCSELNKCDVCFAGRYFFSDENIAECRTCISNCAKCTKGDTCDECNSGYYYKDSGATGTCEKCPSNCKECTHSDGCTECDASYYLDAEKVCKGCSAAITNCNRCSLAGSAVQCTTCDSTFYPADLSGTPGGQCSSCISNCLKCTSDTGCDICDNDYCYDSAEQVCRGNSGRSCDTCEKRDAGVSCLTCNAGRFLDMCQACKDSNCVVCDDAADQCTQCRDGTYVVTASNDCSLCPTNCLMCSDGTSCSKCKAGTVWDAATTACISCPPLCSECSSADVCLNCTFQNTYKDTSVKPNLCTSCITGCLDCTDGTFCQKCFPGFTPDMDANSKITACVDCGVGCSGCTLGADKVTTTCVNCTAGYTMIGSQCVACSTFSNCLNCMDANGNSIIDGGDCIECQHGYVMSDDQTQCLACNIAGCENCRDRKFVCETCSGTTIPTADQYSCGKPCWFCQNDDECSSAPSLNGTMPKPGSSYKMVGCPNGCLITRNDTSDGVVYSRGCLEKGADCGSLSSETCMNYGEGTSKVSECQKCCEGEVCNTDTLTGQSAGAASITATIFVIGVVSLLISIIMI